MRSPAVDVNATACVERVAIKTRSSAEPEPEPTEGVGCGAHTHTHGACGVVTCLSHEADCVEPVVQSRAGHTGDSRPETCHTSAARPRAKLTAATVSVLVSLLLLPDTGLGPCGALEV